MHEHLRWIDGQLDSMTERLIRWSNINSGTRNLAGLAQMLDVLDAEFASLGGTSRRATLPPTEEIDSAGNAASVPLGEALLIEKRPSAPLRVLLNIHYDTVFGEEHPFQVVTRDGDTLRGPGVVDAKGGIIVMLTALTALERSPFADKIGWEVLLNPDEEIGSPGSASLLREVAQRNQIGLVFEPAMRDGSLVGARKGSGTFVAVVSGRAAHAGRDFALGRSATVALADLILRLDAIRIPGVTINCGKIEGGGATNIVPDLAIGRFNVRVETPVQQIEVIHEIEASIAETSRRDGIAIKLHGQFASPPKPLEGASSRLMEHIIATGQELGLSLRHVPSGGICDGNKLAAAGLPVVDSLGPVGGELHSDREYVHLPSLVERARLVALLLMKFAAGEIVVR